MSDKNKSVDGVIGSGVMISGKISFEGVLRIDGRFSGEIDASGTLVIGENAIIESMIKTDTALISGEVRGVIEAARIELLAKARIYGEIRTPVLIVYDGAFFEGACRMCAQRELTIKQLPL
ncbi:MAG: polymer-forming cytoskeletal protein [Nitrospirae bacterium]|nr:polymer-forming cytoskeletal protein [Nitrospirota bacterium]